MADSLPRTWLQSDRVLARRLGRPISAFLHVEASGGILLVCAAIAALVWANSGWSDSYERFFHTSLTISIGSFTVKDSLAHAINDGLMAVFFFVVGLEIKREWVVGELRDRRAAALPAIAALGGMVVPALIFVLIANGEARHGWGIPMATDIAFALGVVAILGSRVPSALKVFLLTLAIVDDIGAIIVIAVFYSGALSMKWLIAAALITAVVVMMRKMGVRYLVAYVVTGFALWLCVYKSCVHATIAGVVLGLLTPALAFLSPEQAEVIVDDLDNRADLDAAEIRRVSFLLSESVPVTDRLIHALHPWTSYVIVPIFALANAGIRFGSEATSSAGTGVAIAVAVGLVVGKILGISLFSWAGIKARIGVLPEGVRFIQLVALSAVAGIGFTVSLFVAGLAYADHPDLLQGAKIGILGASVLAAVIGSIALSVVAQRLPTSGGTSTDE